MSTNHYYQSELTALRQLGRRFSERNPALAPFLGQSGKDPDVERLLEGFAFLTGRLRQKLDDELPELTHSLMQLLWPNYMRPLPSFCMVQFDSPAMSGPPLIIGRGTPLYSKPIDGTPCSFRTCYGTEVHALKLVSLKHSAQGDGALLSLRLEMNGQGHLGALGLSRLRLHFAGERYISQMLYLSLLRKLKGIQMIALDAAGEPISDATFSLPVEAVTPVGFAEDEALIPYPLNTFRGYRHIQEYFAFQDKFLFVDIDGLQRVNTLPDRILKQVRGFELRFDIRNCGTLRIRPTLDNVKLNCTPAVNLFTHSGSPIRFSGKDDEYLLMPTGSNPENFAVFSVDEVTGWHSSNRDYDEYVPFESFEHDPSFDVPNPRPFYSVRQRPSLTHEGIETYMSFGIAETVNHDTVSIDLTCTNHNLPLKLKLGDICVPREQDAGSLGFRNITSPTPSYAPPVNREFLWKLISNMSLNYLSLANVNALKVILETYDLPRYYDQHAQRVSKRLLDGLQSISHQPVDRLYRGLPVRGVRTDLTIDPSGYLGEGDLFVFASVLNEFFALYASLNSYHELRVTSTQGDRYQWTPRMGLQPLL